MKSTGLLVMSTYQYFVMQLYLNGREKSHIELDSLKAVNKNFTNLFYEQILQDLIEEYPKEYLFPEEPLTGK